MTWEWRPGYFAPMNKGPSIKAGYHRAMVAAVIVIGFIPVKVAVSMLAPSAPVDATVEVLSRKRAAQLGAVLLREHDVEAEKTAQRIRALVSDAQKDAPKQAAQATAPFLGFQNTAGNVWMLTCDKVRGSHHLEDRATLALRPALRSHAELAAKICSELQQLEYTMCESDNRYRKQVLAVGAKAGISPGKLTMDDQSFQAMLQTQRRTTLEVAGASVATAIELVLIRSTVESFQVLAAVAIGRLSGTATVAATAAVADGPFPVGDVVGGIIAVGGSAWTIWDIRKATEAMHNLQPTIQRQILAGAQKLGQEALNRVEAMGAAHASVAKLR